MKNSFRRFLIAILSVSGLGQVLYGQTLEFQMRQGQPHPWQSTAYPEDQFITPTASNGLTAKITGELLAACAGACFTVKPRAGGIGGEMAISFAGHGAELLTPGLHTADVGMGPQHWTVRLHVLKRAPYLPFFYRAGYPMGCRNSNAQMPFQDTCVISNEQPARGLGALERPGDSFRDPQFGSPVHRMTESGFLLAYSSMRMFSANARYVLVADSDGFLHVWERESNRQLGAPFSGFNFSQAVWDPMLEERLWFIAGGQVGYRDVRTGKVNIAADYTGTKEGRPALAGMTTGGTADNTDDNWWVITEPKEKLVCALDLNGLMPANQEAHLFCSSYSALGIRLVDFPQITQIDSESKKRYVLLLSEPRSHVFSVNTVSRKLEYEYEMPAEITTPHSDVSQDSHGRQVLFWAWYDRFGDKSFSATSLLNKREKMTRPIEEGGGLALLFPIYAAGIRTDAHFGCNWSGYCVQSLYADPVPGGIANWTITDVKSGTPCVLRVSSDHPFKDGDQAVIGGVGEMSGVNGLHVVKIIDSRTLDLEGKTCRGRYERKRGHLTEARQWAPTAPNRDWITVVRLDGEVRPIAIHRSKLWAEHGDLYLYWAAPQAGISRDGKYVGFTSNLGLPEPNSVLWAEVDTSDEIRNANVRAGLDEAMMHWEGPPDATVRVSPDRDFQNVVFMHRFTANQVGDHSIPGLNADTVYYYEIAGTNSAARGSFHTRKAVADVR